MSTGNPDVNVRFGLGVPGNFWWSPWQQHFITEFVAIPRAIGPNNGYRVRIRTADYFAKFNRASRVQARKGAISEIVREIAEFNQLSQTVIEPTRGTYSLIQSYEPDFTFILRRLLSRAVNDRGRGNFKLFFKDGALHFHSPDFQAQLHELDYFSSARGVELFQNDLSQLQVARGAARVKVITFDPLTSETHVVESKLDQVLKLAKNTPELRKLSIDLNCMMHVGQNLAVDSENFAQNKFEQERSQLYTLSLVTSKTPYIRVGDFLNVAVEPTASPSPWSGYYYVERCRHVIDNSTLNSSFILRRGEFNSAGKPNFNQAEVFNQSEGVKSSAPGQLLNVSAVRSSTKLKGSESATLKPILDPQSAEF
jgi:hypothetical protein